MRRSPWLGLASLLLIGMILASPILAFKAYAQEGVVIRIITRHPGEILNKAKEEFLKSDIAKQYNIVDIKFYSFDPTLWVSAIERAASKGNNIDVAWGGGPTLFDNLYEAGLLAPLTSQLALEAAGQIPDTYAGAPMKRMDDNKIYWVAASIASFGFTVNHDVLNKYGLPVPKRWADLASPVYAEPLVRENKPVVAIADPTRSTSNTRMYEIILQAYGWENGWINLTLMAANSLVEGGSSDVRDDVILGRVAVGITIDFYGYTAMKTNPACEYILPPGESIVNGDPIALLTTSANPEAAQAFIAWVLTEGQKVWFDPNINRLPSNPNAFNLPEGKERQDLKNIYDQISGIQGIEFDDALALKYEKGMQQYFKTVLVDLNSLLKEVWRKLVKLYMDGYITEDEFKDYAKRLGSPLTYVDPYTGEKVTWTMENAIEVTKKLKDPEIQSEALVKYSNAWKKAATEKYRSILDELKEIEKTRTPGATQEKTKTQEETTMIGETTEQKTTQAETVQETQEAAEETVPEGGGTSRALIAIIVIIVIVGVAVVILRR
ncbi:MAG: ABC transporter substrate-binding protein [Desulfurococcales archaeon]|nr:ABC transporter substrate-binding protein [Desulfurococcales archaeon]MCE4604980.1 ABC transporter substrate-binding protein [Desulfurococcales archaeon]